jgi:predicted transcriptional regulator
MTRSDLPTPSDRVLVLGPRELDVMRLLWEHGPATVRELHTWLLAEPPIAYSTLLTICVTLTTKGLLTRRPATDTAARALKGNPYIYAPTIGPATFTHVMVGRTTRLIAPYPAEQLAATTARSHDCSAA